MKEKEIEKKREIKRERRELITRAKIVELLSERHIRSQHTPVLLAWFSPNLHLSTRKDVSVALFYSLLFCFLLISSLLTFRYRFFKTSALLLFFQIFLPVCLKICRHRKLKRKRERRFLLPISM
ncbi:hypothetical protein LUZ63_017732 [Rhynchospora breviuscula]|uniref:Uncharacterized protein n=1 Tax=Rhynchospora breviuscula TaxID=2022672 RepID=A0A9Q0C2Z9_9POAL|nr:hypothetical protein LUZ63_017732 [Rhynchospora breviuscula]